MDFEPGPEDMKEWMRHITPDYRMNLIDARHMTDEEMDREKLKSPFAILSLTVYKFNPINRHW